MKILERSFILLSDGNLENLLKKATDKTYKSFLFGLGSTALMQSSGLVSILAISFLSANIISLASSIAISYGANLGTVIPKWLIATVGLKANIAKYAMMLSVFGVFLNLSKDDKNKGLGLLLLSLGLLILGIDYIKNGFDNLKDIIDLTKFALGGYLGIITYALLGVILTALMQSSTVALAILLSAVSAGQVDYFNAAAFAVGSNLGSVIMTVFGAVGAGIQAKRMLYSRLIFNTFLFIMGTTFIKFFMHISDESADFFGLAQDDYVIKLAFFHTFVNLFGVILFLPFTKLFADFLTKIIKDKKQLRDKINNAIYLNDSLLKFPDASKDVLLQEMSHLYNNFSSIIAKSISISLNDIKSDLSESEIVQKRREAIKIDFDELYNTRFKELYSDIISFIIKADMLSSEKEDRIFFMDMRRANIYLAEAAKDLKNIQENFYKFLKSSNSFIVKEYDNLREDMIKFLRTMDSLVGLRTTEDFSKTYKELIKLNRSFEDIFERQSGTLLYENKISNKMATSLMNDAALFLRMTKTIELAATIIYKHLNLRAEENK